MPHTKRLSIGILLPLFMLFARYLLAEATKEEFTLAFIGGFTGPGSEYSIACRNGAELAVAERNGGVRIIYEDDQSTASKTVSAYRKFMHGQRPDIVFVSGSTPGNAIAPLSQRDGVPLVAWAGDSSVSTGRANVFRAWVRGDRTGCALGEEIGLRGHGRLLWLSSIDDYSAAVTDGFRQVLSDQSTYQEVAPDLMDFKPILMHAKADAISDIGVCLGAGQAATLSRQAKELAMPVRFFGCETLYDSNEIASANGALEAAWLVTIDVQDSFRDRYLKRFSNDDLLGGAAVTYELIHIFRSYLATSRRGSIMDYLMTVKEPHGALRSLKSVNDGGDRHFEIGLVVKEVLGKQFITRKHITSQCNRRAEARG